jgi:hypothetical protein
MTPKQYIFCLPPELRRFSLESHSVQSVTGQAKSQLSSDGECKEIFLSCSRVFLAAEKSCGDFFIIAEQNAKNSNY